MRSVASKTTHKLQLDLPLDQSRLDLSNSVSSLSPASPEAIKPEAKESFVTPLDLEQLDRPVSFPIEAVPVVATLPEECPRETKLSVGIDTDTNRNLYHSSGRTAQDAAPIGRKLTGSAMMAILTILQHVDGAREHAAGLERVPGHTPAHRSETGPTGGSERNSCPPSALSAPGTDQPPGRVTSTEGHA